MTDTKDLKAEAKSVWKTIKHYGSQATAVFSDLMELVTPKWLRAEAMWKAWTWTKRGIAIGILAVSLFLGWKFSVDITRLSIGSFRAASAYGHGTEITKSDLKSFATDRDISNLQDQITSLKADLASMDDKIDQRQSSKITTGALPAKKKFIRRSPAKKSSFSVQDLSKYLP